MGNPMTLAAAAALLAASLAGCARRTVKIPDADMTPPIPALDVVGQGKRIVLFPGDQPGLVELAPGDSVVLIALGEDRDGGVKDLSLTGEATVTCGDPSRKGKGAAQRRGAFSRRHVLPALPGWRVPGTKSSRYVLRASEFEKMCLPGGLRGVSGTAGVRAVNYHGISSLSPMLEFRVVVTPGSPRATKAKASASHASKAANASQDSKGSQRVFGPLPASEYPDTPRI